MATATLTGKFTAASRAFGAKLQPAPAVSAPAGTKFAVDVRLANGNTPAYKAGVVVRYFVDESKAKAMVDGLNRGDLSVVGNASKQAWYAARKPHSARVIPAYAIPVGKSAKDVLDAKVKAGKARKPRKQATTATTATATTATPAAMPATATPPAAS